MMLEIVGAIAVLAASGAHVQATPSGPLTSAENVPYADRERIAAAVDSIVANALRDGAAAGVSVAVVLGGDTIVLKGYGFAELEHGVPTPERAAYEIGSVTKQFTAAAILQLQERGELSLDDDLTTFLPDYPTAGHRITLRHLLYHTSGIRSYTAMPEFALFGMRKLPRDSLVALFAAEPFDFAPGEAQRYNNSGYFLLGLVIERVSGQSYEEYVRRNLFDRAGMPDSRYCDERAVVERRAHGYAMGPDGLLRAPYLDHTWPYAAGSLCSTAWDLIAWNQALHGGRILAPESYRELVRPGTLADGTRLRYAAGVGVDSLFGRRAISHGGGIYGYLTDVSHWPDEDLTIVVLINTAGPVAPGAIKRSIAEAIFGAWTPRDVPLPASAEAYAGEYRGRDGDGLVVRIAPDDAGSGLTVQVGEGPVSPLVHIGGEVFERDRNRFAVVRERGRVAGLRADFVGSNALLERRPGPRADRGT